MDDKDIYATLNDGKYFGGKSSKMINAFYIISIVLLSICILLFVLTLFMYDNTNETREMLLLMLFLVIYGLSIFLTMLYVKKRNNKLKSKINSCLEDAILTTGKVKKMNYTSKDYKPYQIEVTFSIDNKTHKKYSATGKSLINDYKFFSKFDGKTINILYSPKYDEVLILKN